MKQEKFEALVRSLEPFAKREPRRYQICVGLLAALGYVYLFIILVVVVALIGALAFALILGHAGIVLIKLAIPLIAIVSVVIRSLWVRIPPPDEPELKRETAPRLFAMLDDLSRRLKAPRLHHVLLTDDFNAGILQVPKLGLFGWQTNYLMLGLPLMEALSPDQFRAVIAHEMGHLSGNHSRFSAWIYRVRQTWMQLLTNLYRRRHWGVHLFAGFFRWYAPYFSAYSFVLARSNEYVADRCAAEVAGRENAAEALVSLQVRGQYLQERFWPDLLKRSYVQPEPPAPFAAMFQGIRQPLPPADTERWLDVALEERTDLDDTHPCLTDRLAALGYRGKAGGPLDLPQPPLPVPSTPTETAAQVFLGQVGERHAGHLDQAWKQQIADDWKKQYRKAQDAMREIDVLERQSRTETLSVEESWKRVRLIAEFVDEETALPFLKELVAAHPDHAAAGYTLGKLLVERNDGLGLAYLDKAMAQEPASIVSGSDMAYRFLKAQGRIAEALRYRTRAQQQQQILTLAQEERARLEKGDQFLYHGLTPDGVTDIRAQLTRLPQIKEAYLIRKKVTYLPERPLYVLGVVMKKSALQLHSDAGEEQALMRRLRTEVQFPGEAFLVLMNGQNRWLTKALRELGSSNIYRA